ncbi:hypothetical protein TrVE_jg13684 [Triparma verrucosa]|uniref:Uncharacterized protein n=1 Tax=Triparma verrucosa TaxID=1606542 RepID=A0A9W7EZG8_9STRA|nr:hypothetical protein TrVE_jg13684 [Triparma verrucosa]
MNSTNPPVTNSGKRARAEEATMTSTSKGAAGNSVRTRSSRAKPTIETTTTATTITNPPRASSVAELAMVFMLPSVVEFLVGPPKLAVSKEADFVTVGRLASISKDSAVSVRCDQLWKPAYVDVTGSVAEEYDHPSVRDSRASEVVYSTWTGERGLLNIFKPDSILAASHPSETTFFRALGMLLSRTCQICDAPAHGGSSFACLRLCKNCTATKLESQVLGPSHVNRFLLTKGDLKKAGISGIAITKYKKPDDSKKDAGFVTKELYGVKALEVACLNKYGSVENVVALGAEKKRAAKKKYDDSQKSEKPMKNRSVFEHLDIYDGDLSKFAKGVMGTFYNVMPLGYVNRDKVKSSYDPSRYTFTRCYQERVGPSDKQSYRVDDLMNVLLIKDLLKKSASVSATTSASPGVPFISLTPPHRDTFLGLEASSLVEGSFETSETHESMFGTMVSNGTTTAAILTIGKKNFYLVREEIYLEGCHVTSTRLLVHRNDNKGIPLVLLDAGEGEAEMEGPISPARFHPRLLSELRALGLPDNTSLQDFIVSLLKALTPSRTLWKSWYANCRDIANPPSWRKIENSKSLQLKVMTVIGQDNSPATDKDKGTRTTK